MVDLFIASQLTSLDALIQKIDGLSISNNDFAGPIGKDLKNSINKPKVRFEPIKNCLPNVTR